MDGPTISLQQAASRLRTKEGATRGLVLSGKLRGFQGPNGRWRVLVEDVERMERQLAVERAALGGRGDLADRIGRPLYQTLVQMHTWAQAMTALQIQFNSALESLSADAAEFEAQGETGKAAEYRAAAADMEKATYGLDLSTGKLVLGLRQDNGSVSLVVGQPA